MAWGIRDREGQQPLFDVSGGGKGEMPAMHSEEKMIM